MDHFSWSCNNGRRKRKRSEVKEGSINGHVDVVNPITHDHLDGLQEAMRLQHEASGCAPGLWKADIDAAFRRVPLREDHKWAAVVAYCYKGEVWIAMHEAMPFGATASVMAWDSVGALILEIARVKLHLPAFRYVDDYFAAERPGIMKHGLSTFVRLVRALLGSTAIADAKTEAGRATVILGILVQSSCKGVRFNLCPKKAAKWSLQISTAIDTLHLDSGTAQKLAGRLTFATQHLFHKLGRAMIKPVYAQKTSGSGHVGPRLLKALRWWLKVLVQNVSEFRPWEKTESKACRLFVDAASTPPRCAAVLFIDGRICFTDVKPSAQLMSQLQARKDNQITSLVCPCTYWRVLVHLCAARKLLAYCSRSTHSRPYYTIAKLSSTPTTKVVSLSRV